MVWYVIKILVLKKKCRIQNLGLSIKCQIVGENLECIILLPDKYRTHIEGLAGNFNGDYTDDLINTQTNQIVTISAANTMTSNGNDATILSACRSCKFR